MLKFILSWLKAFFSVKTASAPVEQKITGTMSSFEPKWLAIARAELGTKEISGDGSNPEVEKYLASTTLPKSMVDDETPWCSAFVNWVMKKADISGVTNDAWARSWLNFGIKLQEPMLGCIVVFERGASSGHVAFYIKDDGANIIVLGGNQADAVCEMSYPKSRVLGYRWPKG